MHGCNHRCRYYYAFLRDLSELPQEIFSLCFCILMNSNIPIFQGRSLGWSYKNTPFASKILLTKAKTSGEFSPLKCITWIKAKFSLYIYECILTWVSIIFEVKYCINLDHEIFHLPIHNKNNNNQDFPH